MPVREGKKYIVRHTGLSSGHTQGHMVTESDFQTPEQLGWPAGHQSLFDRFVETGGITPASEEEIAAYEHVEAEKQKIADQAGIPVETLSATHLDELRTEILRREAFWKDQVESLESELETLKARQDQVEESHRAFKAGVMAQEKSGRETSASSPRDDVSKTPATPATITTGPKK